MAKKLTEKEKQTIQKAKDNLTEKSLAFINMDILPELRESELPFCDYLYITQRMRDILDEKIEFINFFDKSIQEMRKAMLKSNFEEAKSRKVKIPKNADERQMRCEKLAKVLADKLFDIGLPDDEYLELIVTNDNELTLRMLTNSMIDTVSSWLEGAVVESEKKANKKLWGDKEREDRTFKQLNKILE